MERSCVLRGAGAQNKSCSKFQMWHSRGLADFIWMNKIVIKLTRINLNVLQKKTRSHQTQNSQLWVSRDMNMNIALVHIVLLPDWLRLFYCRWFPWRGSRDMSAIAGVNPGHAPTHPHQPGGVAPLVTTSSPPAFILQVAVLVIYLYWTFYSIISFI